MKEDKLSTIIKEEIRKLIISEDKTVTFNGQVNPKYGWAVIMCGAPGSGKSTAARQHLPIQGKIISSDYFREVYADMINTKNKELKYDLRNKNDIKTINGEIGYKKRNFYQKNLDNIRNANINGKCLPNLIFDTMGVNIGAFKNIVSFIKSMGNYKVSFVYVATNRNVAFVNNMNRDRMIPETPFHTNHNYIGGMCKGKDMQSVYQLLKNYSDVIDEAWIIVNSSYDEVNGIRIDRRTNDEENKSNVVKLEKINGKFQIPELFGTDNRKPFLGNKKNISLQDILGGHVNGNYLKRHSPKNDEDLSDNVYPRISDAMKRAKEKGYPLKNTNVKYNQDVIDKRREKQLQNIKQGKPGISHSSLI